MSEKRRIINWLKRNSEVAIPENATRSNLQKLKQERIEEISWIPPSSRKIGDGTSVEPTTYDVNNGTGNPI